MWVKCTRIFDQICVKILTMTASPRAIIYCYQEQVNLGDYKIVVCVVCRNIATIAVFYALPVIQLVITYQTVR